MVYRASVISMMIASPSDVIEQRDSVRAIAANWNFINSFSRQLILMPVGWETHAYPDLSGRPQSLINENLLKECDLLVGIFWTRLGTPTGEFGSGTVEEIETHVASGKPAMVYFSEAPVAPQSIDSEQFSKVQNFKRWCYTRGLVENFSSSEEFRLKFESQLQIQLNTNPYLKGILNNVISDESNLGIVAELSIEAQKLLVAISQDSHGYVISTSSMSGRAIQVGAESFGSAVDRRSSARWESALEELITLRYVIARGAKGEVFQITDSGYKRADEIKVEGISVQQI